MTTCYLGGVSKTLAPATVTKGPLCDTTYVDDADYSYDFSDWSGAASVDFVWFVDFY